jgi:hypothetical protein
VARGHEEGRGVNASGTEISNITAIIRPEFFDDLYRHLLEPDNTVSRRFHAVRTEQGVNYWILWSD